MRPGSAGDCSGCIRSDRVTASSLAGSEKAICIIFVALTVWPGPCVPPRLAPSAKAGCAGIPVAAFARKAVLDAAGF